MEIRKFDFDCCVTIDADLQQDETKIKDFVEKYTKGYEIVYGVRNDRKSDSLFKKVTATMFYKLMNILGAKTCPNHSEYRLTSRRVIDIISDYHEKNIFLRGIFQDIGLKTAYVNFNVKKREAGESKFSLFDLISLALQGITSFSIVPLRLVTFTGLFMAICSFVLGLSVIYERLFNDNVVPGWATIVCTVAFIGGIQILCLGIIGEYMGQLFIEMKSRPRYLIEEELK